MKFASLFTGGGGADIGAAQAGCVPCWGVESSETRGYWFLRNAEDYGAFELIVGDVRDLDFTELDMDIQWLHASPPHTNKNEVDEDISIATAMCRAVYAIQPDFFTLEALPDYQHFASFTALTFALESMNYNITYKSINMADYGIPQFRKRLFLIASNKMKPKFPEQIHKHKSWFDSIYDLSLRKNAIPEQLHIFFHSVESGEYLTRIAQDEKIDIVFREHPCFELNKDSGAVETVYYVRVENKEIEIRWLSLRALARLQTFPDEYELPTVTKIAAHIIGEATPPLFMKQLIECNHSVQVYDV